ncbi:CHAT domain-containing protein, partial [Mycena maculata]
HLSVCLSDVYNRFGKLEDLEAAVKINQAAVAQTPPGHPKLAERLYGLAVSFGQRYQRSDNLEDLNASLKNYRAAVEETPEGHPDLPMRLCGLSVSLSDAYNRFGRPEDLEAALENNRAAVAQTPENDPHLSERLGDLGVSYGQRYRRSGNLQDLEAALENVRAAVEKTPNDHPDLAGLHGKLAKLLSFRYERLNNPQDLEAALQNQKLTIEKTPKDHPDLADCLSGLAMVLRKRYGRFGNIEDLNDALRNDEAAIAQTQKDDPHVAERVQSLGASFFKRYLKFENPEDLDSALQNIKSAVAQTSEDHPHLPFWLQSLAVCFKSRYMRLWSLDDLEAALENGQAAVALLAKGDLRLPNWHQVLAMCLWLRYRRSENVQDLEDALSNYHESFKGPTSDFIGSWRAALLWASFAKRDRPSEMLNAYSAAFNLLPDILWIGSSISVRQHTNRRINITQAISDAINACIDYPNLTLAIEILEQGMGTTFQQLLQLKANLDFLPQADATKLQRLSMQLYNGTASDEELPRIAAERNTLLTELRQRPGLEYLLRPRPFTELCQASQHGPIVILNSHSAHCDSFILLNPTLDPIRISLPEVSLDRLRRVKAQLKDMVRGRNIRSTELEISRMKGKREGKMDLKDILTWIWTSIANPVYLALKSNGITSGRLWWCPTGEFVTLPLHAADSTDEFIHSYTSTLGALLEAMARKSSDNLPNIGLVGVTYTGPGRTDELPGVEQEIEQITSIVPDKYQVQSLRREEATVVAVTQQLNNSSWLHLACHGSQNLVEPPKSCLHLYGGTLELETILRMPLPNAEFVFLAACQTAKGDAKLVNESFHLGSGFIAAGFQAAIATMWSMCDSDGPIVAEAVYNHIFGREQRPRVQETAKALQLAVRKLQQQGVPPERWVPFIHIGL